MYVYVYTNTCIYILTYICTYIHTYVHTQVNKYMRNTSQLGEARYCLCKRHMLKVPVSVYTNTHSHTHTQTYTQMLTPHVSERRQGIPLYESRALNVPVQ